MLNVEEVSGAESLEEEDMISRSPKSMRECGSRMWDGNVYSWQTPVVDGQI